MLHNVNFQNLFSASGGVARPVTARGILPQAPMPAAQSSGKRPRDAKPSDDDAYERAGSPNITNSSEISYVYAAGAARAKRGRWADDGDDADDAAASEADVSYRPPTPLRHFGFLLPQRNIFGKPDFLQMLAFASTRFVMDARDDLLALGSAASLAACEQILRRVIKNAHQPLAPRQTMYLRMAPIAAKHATAMQVAFIGGGLPAVAYVIAADPSALQIRCAQTVAAYAHGQQEDWASFGQRSADHRGHLMILSAFVGRPTTWLHTGPDRSIAAQVFARMQVLPALTSFAAAGLPGMAHALSAIRCREGEPVLATNEPYGLCNFLEDVGLRAPLSAKARGKQRAIAAKSEAADGGPNSPMLDPHGIAAKFWGSASGNDLPYAIEPALYDGGGVTIRCPSSTLQLLRAHAVAEDVLDSVFDVFYDDALRTCTLAEHRQLMAKQVAPGAANERLRPEEP